MTIEHVDLDTHIDLRMAWVQTPLPLGPGFESAIVTINTDYGQVLVTKEWFDRVVLISPAGVTHWRWLLSLLEERVLERAKESALDYLDPQ